MSNACRNLYQFQSDRIHLHLTHGFGKRQTPEPVEQIVGQAMQRESIGIYNHGGRADRAKVEAVLSFLDEVFHGATVAVEADDIPDRKLHVGHNECVQMIHLTIRFLDLHSDTTGLTPGARLVVKLTKDLRIINGIVSGSIKQDFIELSSQLAQRGILLQSNGILAAVVLAGIKQIRHGKPAVTAQEKLRLVVVVIVFIE